MPPTSFLSSSPDDKEDDILPPKFKKPKEPNHLS
jgi:hypothetical protein